MADRVAELIVDVKARESVSSVLTRLDGQLRNTSANADRTAAGIGGRLNTATQQFSGSVLGVLGPLGVATTATAAFLATVNRVQEGFNLQASFEQTRASLAAITGSQDRANQAFSEGEAFADRYKFRLSEINTALGSLGPLMNTSTTATAKQLEVLARLQALAPGKTFADAAFSAKELASLDYTSISEQFNISKSAAAALRDEIAAGGDVFQVLDKYLNDIGVSTQVLETRTRGATGAALDYAQAQENLTLALGRLAEGPGVEVLDFLSKFTDTVTNIVSKGDFFAGAAGGAQQIQATLLQQASSYEDYATRVVAANQQLRTEIGQSDPVFAALVGGLQTLTPLQFAYAQSLVQQGASQTQAVASAQQYAAALEGIASFQDLARQGTEVNAQALDEITQKMIQIATTVPGGTEALNQLSVAFLQGAFDASTLTVNLDAIISAHQLTADAATRDAAQTAFVAQEHANTAVAVADLTSKLNDQASQSLIAQAQGDLLAQTQADLYNSALAAARGSASLGNAAAGLAAQFNLPIERARELISLLRQIGPLQGAIGGVGIKGGGDARGRGQGGARDFFVKGSEANAAKLRDAELSLARAHGDNSRAIAILRQQQQGLNRSSAEYLQLEAQIVGLQRGGGGGAGGKGRGGAGAVKLSDQAKLNNSLLANETKFQNQFEDLELKHAKKLLDIQADYMEKRQEAQRAFEQRELDGRAGFYGSLRSIEDSDLRQSLSAQYEAAVQEAQRIAQEQGPDAGQAFMDAAAQSIQEQGKLQEEINKALSEGDAGTAEYLQGVLALQKAADERRLADIRASGSAIANERQRQIDAENLAYEEQTGKITTASARAADAKIADAVRSGKAIDAENLGYQEQLGLLEKINRAKGGTGAGGSAATPTGGGGAAPTSAGITAAPVPDEIINVMVGALQGLQAAVVAALDDVERAVEGTTSALRSRGGNLE